MTTPRYFLIVNSGSMIRCPYVRSYPWHLIETEQYIDNEKYRAAVKEMQAEYRPIIILDQGAHHHRGTELSEFATVIQHLQPHVAILPDVVGSPASYNRKRCMNFARWAEKSYPDMRLMYCPQGGGMGEIEDEYRWALEFLDPNKYIIGFGQSYLAFEGKGGKEPRDEDARWNLLRRVFMGPVCMPPGDVRHQLHILGARWTPPPPEMVTFLQTYPVGGLDTIKPCHCAINGFVYPGKPKAKVDRTSLEVVHGTELEANVRLLAAAYGLRVED